MITCGDSVCIWWSEATTTVVARGYIARTKAMVCGSLLMTPKSTGIAEEWRCFGITGGGAESILIGGKTTCA